MDGSSRNTQVGGVIPLGNVSAGNGRNGIEVTGTVSGFVTFNTFGGLLAFKGAAPNGNDGLLITSTGGGNLARTNVFSGNRNNGIELAGNASGVTVDPDIVGLNTKGNGVLPNGGNGLLIDGTAHGNVIGGTLRSVIPQDTFSGNTGWGVVITGRAYQNRVFTSDIGTNVLGARALGNLRGRGAGHRAGQAQPDRRRPAPAGQPDQRQHRHRGDADPGHQAQLGDQELHRPEPVRAAAAQHRPSHREPRLPQHHPAELDRVSPGATPEGRPLAGLPAAGRPERRPASPQAAARTPTRRCAVRRPGAEPT